MNAKHQFKYTYNETDLEEFSPLEITFEMPAEISLAQMLYNFERYLQACGFVFDGKLDFVEDSYDLPEEEPEGGCMADWDDYIKAYNEKIENDKKLKEWNEGIAKLENDLKAKRDIEQQAYERAARNAAVVKNNWVHGICNPPIKS